VSALEQHYATVSSNRFYLYFLLKTCNEVFKLIIYRQVDARVSLRA